MKKSLLSIGSLLAVYLLMGSTALALFYPQVSLTGLDLKTANLNLLVAVTDGDNPIFSETGQLSGVTTLQPGMSSVTETFWLKNNSSTNQRLDLTVQIEGQINGDWGVVKDLVMLELYDPQTAETSDWHSLAELYNQKLSMPSPNLLKGDQRKYELHYDFADTYPVDPDGDGPIQVGDPVGNELMGKETGGYNLLFEGTPTVL